MMYTGHDHNNTHLLLDLDAVDDGHELAENLVRFPVVLDLGRDELGEVPQRLRRVKDLQFTKSAKTGSKSHS